MIDTAKAIALFDESDEELVNLFGRVALMTSVGLANDAVVRGSLLEAYALGRLRERREQTTVTFIVREEATDD